MLRRKKEEVLDLPPKLYSTEYVELTTAQKKQYRDIKNGIVADMENILASVNPLNCTLRLRQLTSGNPNLTEDSPKLDRIKEMLEEEIIPNGHKAIIFSQWSTIAKDLGIELTDTPLSTLILGRGAVVPAKDITVTWRERKLNRSLQ